MQDQITFPFWFKITPTEITQSQRSRTDNKKAVLIKLGPKQDKTKVLNQPIELVVDILYSKTLNKFCPIKGIIKIYDINPDGSEMISCVGSFNTEELLNQRNSGVVIERDIGHCKLRMVVEVKQLSKEQPKTEKSLSPGKLKSSYGSGDGSRSNFSKGEQKMSEEMDCQETPYIIDDSMDQMDKLEQISASYYSDYSEELRKDERNLIGEQLVEERRNNKILEQRLEKSNMKVNILKKHLQQKNIEIKSFINHFQEFTKSLQFDSKGQYIFEMSEKKRELAIRYKPNTKFRECFQNFLTFMTKNISENASLNPMQKSVDLEASSNQIMKKIESDEEEKTKLMEENKKLNTQINKLKSELHQLNATKPMLNAKNSRDLASTIAKKNDQILSLQTKLRKVSEEKKNLEGINQYLQEKDSHMESIINSKETTIENLNRMISDATADLNSLEEKNVELQKTINNFELMVEQMKEQNANLQETIEEYRQKFGDLKIAKDKALERQLRECLRWIDQQNRDEELSMEENTLSFTDTTPAMNQIMKGISEIENMPLSEMSLIRKQVINVLKRIDELIARNSISG